MLLLGETMGCGCSTQAKKHYIIGAIQTKAGAIPQISTKMGFRDILGSWKSRWDFGRMDHTVNPGIYAVGNPDDKAPVLVTANYKMTFDRLREQLRGLNLWIMVLDTKGINVWCAAGKGTFGTEELINRITLCKLSDIISHRTIILPQLGAPGVAAHTVTRATGFRIIYGPVLARDIPSFINSGFKAEPQMREIHFNMWDRLILTPVELAGLKKPALTVIAILFMFQLIGNHTAPFLQLLSWTLLDVLPFAGAVFTGAVLAPVLLPYIPGRSLAWKGFMLGLLWVLVYATMLHTNISHLQTAAYLLLLPAISSFLFMNFTGATTYTSLSGVIKEMKYALPVQIVSAIAGTVLLFINIFIK